jgi:KDO2-lipid IV(A) lauroyltransferase
MTAAPAGVASWARGALLGLGSGLASRLPAAPLVVAADAGGELWYRAAPARAEQGRLNLRRVCQWLAANDMASDRVSAAADDPAALERLLRSAFRHAARYYLEVARAPGLTAGMLHERLVVETPRTLDAAIEAGPVIFVGLHFGAIELPAMYLANRSGLPVTVPMETIDDRDLQGWFERTRGATGIRLVDVRHARRELLAALRRGEPVGLVGDRDISGGGTDVEFFGARAPLPAGPGLLAVETGAPVYAVAVRRTGRSRYRGRVERLTVPSEGTRRERVLGYLQTEARGFERLIALAPDQWWALFFPIRPDLVVAERGPRRRRPEAGA